MEFLTPVWVLVIVVCVMTVCLVVDSFSAVAVENVLSVSHVVIVVAEGAPPQVALAITMRPVGLGPFAGWLLSTPADNICGPLGTVWVIGV